MFYFDEIMNNIGYKKDMEFKGKKEALILRYVKICRNIYEREYHYICFYADKTFSKYFRRDSDEYFTPDVITMKELEVINQIVNEYMWNRKEQ